MVDIQVLLLAAGASKRMGKAKQLLPWGRGTLIEHQVKTLLKASDCVSVVLGASAKVIKGIIGPLPINIYTNEYWETGMGSSIAYGVQQIVEAKPKTDGILISLIDQPLLSAAHFIKMIEQFRANKKQLIVSQSENGWLGAPVLFDCFYFNELLQLKADEGAKLVINKHTNLVKKVYGGSLLEDMDTPETYKKLVANFKEFS